MTRANHARETTTLFTQFPPNRRIPFKQIFLETWAATLALVFATCLVLAAIFYADGKPVNSNRLYANIPTIISLGAVILRGSIAYLLGIALYQSLWGNIAVPTKTDDELCVEIQEDRGVSLKKIESLQKASRLAVGLIAYPLFKAGWIIGLLGFLITAAIQPVLTSAIAVRQEPTTVPIDVPIYHLQFDAALSLPPVRAGSDGGATAILKRSANAALLGEQGGLKYTDANATGFARFGPIKYLDITCEIQSRESKVDYGKIVYNLTSVYRRSSIEVHAVMFNNTHYLNHTCMVQTAIGTCSTNIKSGVGIMSDLDCYRDQLFDVSDDLRLDRAQNRTFGGVVGLLRAFEDVFVGWDYALNSYQAEFKSNFLLATLIEDEGSGSFRMPSDLFSHMKRVLWVTPLIGQLGYLRQERLNVTMSVLDERDVIVYEMETWRVIATVAVLSLIGLGCLSYLAFGSCGACGRLTRDSLIHSLTVAGPNGPAIPGACLASLSDILEKLGDRKLTFGVLLKATDSLSGHLGFAEQPLALGSHENRPMTVEKPVPGKWYGGQGELRERKWVQRRDETTRK